MIWNVYIWPQNIASNYSDSIYLLLYWKKMCKTRWKCISMDDFPIQIPCRQRIPLQSRAHACFSISSIKVYKIEEKTEENYRESFSLQSPRFSFVFSSILSIKYWECKQACAQLWRGILCLPGDTVHIRMCVSMCLHWFETDRWRQCVCI